MTTALLINSSGRTHDSITRKTSSAVTKLLQQQLPDLTVIERNLNEGTVLPFVDATWIDANFTAADVRTSAHQKALNHSDLLIEEIKKADYVVVASPIYNFSVPAVLKAWIDQIARAKVTFQYTAKGPVGLLQNKKAILVMASGGVHIESPLDFATPYLQQVMRFIGIEDILVIDANSNNIQTNQSIEEKLNVFLSHNNKRLTA